MIRGGFILPRDIEPDMHKALSYLYDTLNASNRELTEVKKKTDALSVNEPDDATPPNPVKDLVFKKFETHIRLEWANPSNSDLSHIRVTKTVDSQPDSEKFIVPAPANHIDDLDTIATSDYVYELVAVDGKENESTPKTIAVNSEVLPAPTELLYLPWEGDDLELSWDQVDGFGVSGYRVVILNGGLPRRIEDVTSTNYVYTLAKNETDGLYYQVEVNVFTLDASGNPSPAAASETMTHVAPSSVTNVVASLCDLGFKLAWDLSTEPGVLGYVIALNDDVLEENYTTGDYLYKTLLKAGDYQFKVATKNKFNQLSPWAVQNFRVNGPGKPATFGAEVIDNTVILRWAPPEIIELPIVEYEIRKGSVFDTGENVGRKQGTFTIISELISDTYRYWVAGVDSAGNIGEPEHVIVTVDEPPDYVLNVKWVETFVKGVSVNVLHLEDGTAIAPYYVGQTWEQKFIANGTSSSPQYTSFQDFIDAGYTYNCEPVPESAEYSEEHDYDAVLTATTVSLSLAKTDYNGGPTIIYKIASKEDLSGDYVDTVSSRLFILKFQYVRDKYEIKSDGKQFALLREHSVQLDSKLKSDGGNAKITDAQNGVEVEFNKKFIDVISIVPGVVGAEMKNCQVVFDFEDNSYPTSFIMYLFDSSGEKTIGTATWVAKGY